MCRLALLTDSSAGVPAFMLSFRRIQSTFKMDLKDKEFNNKLQLLQARASLLRGDRLLWVYGGATILLSLCWYFMQRQVNFAVNENPYTVLGLDLWEDQKSVIKRAYRRQLHATDSDYPY